MVYGRWMMSQSSDTPFSSSEALVQTKELEHQFFELLSARGPLDARVRNLSNNIRDCYARIILSDHTFAESHDVEQSLWNVHYKKIEEFRYRVSNIKSMSSAADSQAQTGTANARSGRKILLQREPVRAVFKSFLAEASGFYHELISKIRAKYGLSLDLADGIPITSHDESRTVDLRRCQLWCHKCLVHLGDFARYKEHLLGSDPCNFDVSIAADFYRKAISHWPSIGQPHNQLAVLAVYSGDDLLAVYHYFRSLAVENPFPTAKENLTMIFEKNRVKYLQLPAGIDSSLQSSKLKIRNAPQAGKFMGTRTPKLAKRNVTQELLDELINSFFIRFVRLNGLLFTKTSLETFEEVFSAAISNLEQLLALEDTNLEEVLGSVHDIGMGTKKRGAAGALQLVSILICTVHNVSWAPNGNRADLFQYAITASLEILQRIMCWCAETNDASSSPLLPAMLVVLEWLACRPEMAQKVEGDEKQLNAWSVFWKQVVTLLNRFVPIEKKNGDLENELSSSGLEDSEIGTALWEDYELQGFSPLAPAHLALDYSKKHFGNGRGGKKEMTVRLQRLLAAGKAITNSFDGSGTGIFFDEDLGRFCVVGETLQKESHLGELNGNLETEINFSMDTRLGTVTVGAKETEISAKALPNKQAEDDEELIVFKPVVKDQSSVAPCNSSDQLVELPSCSVAAPELQVVNSALFSYSHGLTHVLHESASATSTATSSAASVGNTFLNPVAIEVACPPSAVSMFSSSLLGGKSCSTSSSNVHTISKLLKEVDLTNVSAACNPISTPLSAQDWLNQTGISSIGFTNGTGSSSAGNVDILSHRSKNVLNCVGVIGQPKQHWSYMLNNSDFSAGQDLADSNKLNFEGLIGAGESCADLSLPSGVRSLMSPHLMSEKPSENNGYIFSSKTLMPVDGILSPCKESRSLGSAIIRPPPGFGPRPTNPSTNAKRAQDQLKGHLACFEQQKFDDYRWLDDYKPSNLTPNHEGKHVVSTDYSADYSLWSSGISRSVQPGIGAFPFPMMQSPQFHNGNIV